MQPGSYVPTEYLPVIVIMAFATLFGVGGLIINKLLAPRKFNPLKFIAYESGNFPSPEPREKYNIGFFMLAILFVVFDVEVIFLYPWAVAFDAISLEGFFVMIIFILLIVVGFVYEFVVGALTWHRK